MAPFYVIASMRAASAQAADELAVLFAACREHAEKHEPGTLQYQPVRDMQDPLKFKVFEQYAGPEAVAAHTKTDVYRALGRAGKTLFEGGSKGITIERFTAVDAKSKL
ncbi:hypothetical protein CspHIS471_0700190 [Cutaneotrichosporon sp. HIS471]|nr:hypothetical protein CspHIS471_0700190 [Cutaneotrichosporon sp. HIS471]